MFFRYSQRHPCLSQPGLHAGSSTQSCGMGKLRPQLLYGLTGRGTWMMIFDGLADGLVKRQCAVKALKQWSTLLGAPWSRNVSDVPPSAYTQEIYGDGTKLQGY